MRDIVHGATERGNSSQVAWQIFIFHPGQYGPKRDAGISLATVAVDISGRGYGVLDLQFSENDMLGFATDLIRHFLESLAIEARLNLHARIVCGVNDHHKAEALFKALGRALDLATMKDERIAGKLPTTKDRLEG